MDKSFEEQMAEQQESMQDDKQLAGMPTADRIVLSDEAKLKESYFTHPKMGGSHDQYKNPMIRLSNFDEAANRRMRFNYLLLLKCDDLGKRAARFTRLLWDLMLAESDVYAATGDGRERVMQNTQRSELLRNTGGEQKRPGAFGSLSDLARWRK